MFDILEKYNFWNSQEIDIGYKRKDYINKIEDFIDNKLIKVLLGQRRSGKSYILKMIINYLIDVKKVNPKQILYINMDIYDFNFIQDSDTLMNVVKQFHSKINQQGKTYIFLDEIQEITNWERAVNSLSQDHSHNYEVFITGSNAKLLSSEIATYLSGRYVKFMIYPFSYSEFCDYLSIKKDSSSFIRYLKQGGMPEILQLKENLQKNYVESLKDSIILRDIIQRHKIRDAYLLKRLFNFLMDSIGNLFSVNSIVNCLKSSGIKTNVETVNTYLDYLMETLVIHEALRFDIRGKSILSGEKKYYLNDTGFKYFQTSSFDLSIGKYLENIIYIFLKRQGYSVFVGKLNNLEIDFIAEKNNEKLYIQVAYLLSNENVINREFGNLERLKDNYPKLVISMDMVPLGNRRGIEHICAWDFV